MPVAGQTELERSTERLLEWTQTIEDHRWSEMEAAVRACDAQLEGGDVTASP